MKEYFEKIWLRLAFLGDKSAWVLALIGIAVLGLTDFNTMTALLKWCSFAFLVGGVVIVLARIFFPTISFAELVPKVKENAVASAIVVAAIILFCGFLFFSITYWAK